MTQVAVVSIRDLDRGLILAPERYDPRRRLAASADDHPLTDVAVLISEQTSSASLAGDGRFLVLDTSDARRGLIMTAKVPIGRDEVGSSKKVVKQGDVIISRLRPYLRQVAFVDGGLVPPDVTILCSTEFFVIRSVDDQSISFLAPYLLSSAVQTALAAAQEGGHHPRFSPSVLNGLYLPVELIAERASVSATVEEAAAALRTAEALLARALADASPHSP